MNRKLFATAAAAACLYSLPALAQAPAASAAPAAPFGIRMGMTVADLAAYHPEGVESDPAVFILDHAPNGQPEFSKYILLVTPQRGVCKVIAMGEEVQTSEFGDGLRAAFDQLEGVLASRYGQGRKVDDLKSGSVWDEPRDWMMSLRQHDRDFRTLWGLGATPLPPTLKSVQLKAEADDAPGSGYLALTYEFTNFDDCEAELNTKRSSAF